MCDCVHILYSNEAQCVADAHKIAFGSMPNLINYGNIFHKFCVCFNILEKKQLILFIFGTPMYHNRDLKYVKFILAMCQNVSVDFVHGG